MLFRVWTLVNRPNGLLTVNLFREIPEADKPKQIKINTPGLIKKAASALSSKKVA